MMKKTKTTFILLVILSFFVSCSTNHNLSSAKTDIKQNKVSRNTITNLEKASQTSGNEAESYYNLARIYHFNSQYSNLDQARFYYQKVLSMYQMSNYSDQMKKLQKNYGINVNSLKNTIKDVDEQICNKAYTDCLKSNNLNDFVKFVNKYPNSSLVIAAKDKAFELQKTNNTIAGYADYLKSFPGYRKDEVIQKAANLAKTKKTTDAYCEFLNRFAEQIDDVSKLGLPFFNTVSDYAAVYNRSLKNKNAQTKAKFTDQFINEQSNYCRGNEQRIRTLCKQSPFPFELSNGNKNSMKRLMQSVKTSSEIIFYTETNKGYIMHDGNLFYEGGIVGGRRNGQGKDNYNARESFGSGLDTYEGNFKDGYFHGTGTYTKFYGWWKRGNWNYGEENGSFEEGNHVDHEDISQSGRYVNGKREGVWEIWHCPENRIKNNNYCNHWQDVYINDNKTSGKTISRGLDNYYDNYASGNSGYNSGSYSRSGNSGSSNSGSSNNNGGTTSSHSAKHGTVKEVKFYGYIDNVYKKGPIYQVLFYDDDEWGGGIRTAWVGCFDDGYGDRWYYRKSKNSNWLGSMGFIESGKYRTQEEAINALRKDLYGK